MDFEINFFNASEYDAKLKCTIQKTGKLGFTETTIKELKIDEKKGVKIGEATDENGKKCLYLMITESADPAAFKVNKAGAYYYVNTKALFDKLSYNYTDVNIMFDMVEIESENSNVYKLLKREGKKKRN